MRLFLTFLCSIFAVAYAAPSPQIIHLATSRVSSNIIPAIKSRLTLAMNKSSSQRLHLLNNNLGNIAVKVDSLKFTLGNSFICMCLTKYAALEEELLSLNKLIDKVYEGLVLVNQEQPVAFNRAIMAELTIQNVWTYFQFNAFLCESGKQNVTPEPQMKRSMSVGKHVRFA